MSGRPSCSGLWGGGEDAPWRLKSSLPLGEKLRELARSAVNAVATANPLWHLALSRTDLVFARTEETKARLPRAVQARTLVAQETGAPHGMLPLARPPGPGARLELLFAGRLLGLKGVQFAVGAVALLRDRGLPVRLTVIGSGPMLEPLKAQARALALSDDEIVFIPFLPQSELFARYAAAHVFLFPSLRDAGGNVVQEALSAGVPVVCLKLGGPPSFVNASCGVVVPARDARDEAELVARLADAIASVAASPAHWQQLHQGALARAEQLTWDRQIAHIQAEIHRALHLPVTQGVQPQEERP